MSNNKGIRHAIQWIVESQENQELLDNQDIDELYQAYSKINLNTSFLTAALDEIGLDPVLYVDTLYCRMLELRKDAEYAVPKNIKKVQRNAFSSTMTKLTCDHGVELENNAVSEYSSLVEAEFKGVTTAGTTGLGSWTFSECLNLKRVKFENISELSLGMFQNCIALEEVEVQNGLLVIGREAFYNCPNIKKLVVPNTLQRIRTGAFSTSDKCGLKEITYMGTMEEWRSKVTMLPVNSKPSVKRVICTDGTVPFERSKE